MSVNSKMTAIADAIREKTGGTDALTLDGMAAAIPDVFSSGEKSAYDAFWDSYQDNGSRTQYAGAFAGGGWTSENFKPKYDMDCVGTCSYMFYYSGISGDLVQLLVSLGVTLDFSKSTALHGLFNSAPSITRVGIIDITAAGASCSSLFNSAKVETIDKLVVSEKNVPNSWFYGCGKLKNLEIEGTIANNGFDVHWSTKLSRDSIISIVNALSDTTSGMTVTFSQTAVDAAFTDDEWAALIATKPNWTFTLA